MSEAVTAPVDSPYTATCIYICLSVSRGSVVLHFVIRLKEPRSLTSQDVREMVRLIQDGLQDSIIAVNRESVYLKPDGR